MPRYIVTLTEKEIQELRELTQKGGKGYRIKHAQILLKLDQNPCNESWTYDRIQEAYVTSRGTVAGAAKRFVTEGMEAAPGRKKQQNRSRKVTGDAEAKICMTACSDAPEGCSGWTMQAVADELIRLEAADYITDSTVCNVMKKTNLSHGLQKNGASQKQARNLLRLWRMFLKYASVHMTRCALWSVLMKQINSS